MKLISSINVLPILIIFLTSCSSSNVKSDWDCPKQEGYSCINITQADSRAVKEISTKVMSSPKVGPTTQIVKEIWFAPFIDTSGVNHKADTIKYVMEE